MWCSPSSVVAHVYPVFEDPDKEQNVCAHDHDRPLIVVVAAVVFAFFRHCCLFPSQEGEITFNLQTPSMFVDIRVPKAGVALLGHHRGFHTMTVRFAYTGNSGRVGKEKRVLCG